MKIRVKAPSRFLTDLGGFRAFSWSRSHGWTLLGISVSTLVDGLHFWESQEIGETSVLVLMGRGHKELSEHDVFSWAAYAWQRSFGMAPRFREVSAVSWRVRFMNTGRSFPNLLLRDRSKADFRFAAGIQHYV